MMFGLAVCMEHSDSFLKKSEEGGCRGPVFAG